MLQPRLNLVTMNDEDYFELKKRFFIKFFVLLLFAVGFFLGVSFFANAQTVEWSQLSRTQYNQNAGTGNAPGGKILISTSTVQSWSDNDVIPIVLTWHPGTSWTGNGAGVPSGLAFIQNGSIIATTSPTNDCFFKEPANNNFSLCRMVTFPPVTFDPNYHLVISSVNTDWVTLGNNMGGRYTSGGSAEIQIYTTAGSFYPLNRSTIYTLPLVATSSSGSTIAVSIMGGTATTTCTTDPIECVSISEQTTPLVTVDHNIIFALAVLLFFIAVPWIAFVFQPFRKFTSEK